jgi:Sulfotransferase domain
VSTDRAGGPRPLDFIVIGAQKGGTTSLWQYLRGHPSIAMPALKEAPFFTGGHATEPGAFEVFLANHLGDAPRDALLGKATPGYMKGVEDTDVEEIARRISAQLPSVKLIALLRDPIERAVSHYRMSVRRGIEDRSFDAAAEDSLEGGQLAAGRSRPTETNSYFAQGEYGRVLRAYRAHFPADRLHVEQTRDLEREPEGVLDRVLRFLGLPGEYRPPNLAIHYHRGGSSRIDAEREGWLFEFLEENVWRRLGDDAEPARRMFEHFYEVWSVQPDDERPSISPSTRARLEAHYRADAELLAELGVVPSWIARWNTVSAAGVGAPRKSGSPRGQR